MRYLLLPAAIFAGPACAAPANWKPVLETRLRYEHVDQDGLAGNADALTARARAGVEAGAGALSATLVAQGTLAMAGSHNDGLAGVAATRPVIADPETVALYVAQLRYRTGRLTLTGGRQKILLDDERLVGNVGFRDNAQTFDAVRAELVPAAGVKLDLTYAWAVRTIWGSEGTGARPPAIGGNNVFANVAVRMPAGILTGFAYLVDQDEASVQGYRLSSQTYGLRLAGNRRLAAATALGYQLSYARQTDFHRNPNDYAADYWLADLALDASGWKLNAGWEVLGAGGGAALTSFQTPLGTNFKFQGWADKFLTTPPDGIRDLYLGAGRLWQRAGPLRGLLLQANWHRFESDRHRRHYGNEWDFAASAKIDRTTLSLRHARYDANRLFTDTQKFWVQADWIY
jgi:hypothetical protein